MPETGQKRLLALDANILIDLAAEKRFAQEFRGFFQEQGFTLFVPHRLKGTRPLRRHRVPSRADWFACAQGPLGHRDMGLDTFANEPG